LSSSGGGVEIVDDFLHDGFEIAGFHGGRGAAAGGIVAVELFGGLDVGEHFKVAELRFGGVEDLVLLANQHNV